eukprot:CAMPEP_0116043624 /NCGR_PEP_ID=MMETSP0321-20121206/26500_1 /TAXON_ID=163516 /ORGANISM="Leptocylindrus danicus var. danicus, Strain B650" /LENGTH=57 /DNA_ID=CAMNT_0003524535 /DNA_START=70 /DNA_END=243 /DNA_ORIENTATION=-
MATIDVTTQAKARKVITISDNGLPFPSSSCSTSGGASISGSSASAMSSTECQFVGAS